MKFRSMPLLVLAILFSQQSYLAASGKENGQAERQRQEQARRAEESRRAQEVARQNQEQIQRTHDLIMQTTMMQNMMNSGGGGC